MLLNYKYKNMAPKDVNELNILLQAEHNKLSKKMKLIAVYIVNQPQQVALNTLATIASDIGVFPSTLVRFAQHVGFSGFTQLQQLFKTQIVQSAVNYGQRINDVKKVADNAGINSADIFHDIVNRNIAATRILYKQIQPKAIEQAVQLLSTSKEVIVCGMNRASPIALYFNYMLNNLGVKCHIIDSIDRDMTYKHSHWFNDETTLIAITYNPYSHVTSEIVKKAKKANAKVVCITDTAINPAADIADLLFILHEAEVYKFRSLSVTFCLAQAICVAIGYNKGNTT